MSEKQMALLGETHGVKWYWAQPGEFEAPGVYYWDGEKNVLVQPAANAEPLCWTVLGTTFPRNWTYFGQEAEQVAKMNARGLGDERRAVPLYTAPVAAQSSVPDAIRTELIRLREALQFYADGEHFVRHDETAWDTVSGEPQNLYEDESNTATIEDGTFARLALAAAATPPADGRHTLICQKCQADRAKEDCKGNRMDCGFSGVAQADVQAQQNTLYPSMPDRSKWTLREEITFSTPIDHEGGQNCNQARYIITAAQLDRLDKIEEAAILAQQAVAFVHELSMGAYRPEEIEAKATAIAKLAPLEAQQDANSQRQTGGENEA